MMPLAIVKGPRIRLYCAGKNYIIMVQFFTGLLRLKLQIREAFDERNDQHPGRNS